MKIKHPKLLWTVSIASLLINAFTWVVLIVRWLRREGS